MAYLTLEDTSSNVEILVFPKTLREYSHLVFEGSTVVMGGRISLREERETQIICESICDAEEFAKNPRGFEKNRQKAPSQSKYHGLHLLLPQSGGEVYDRVKNLLEIFDGTTPVYFKFQDSGKRVAAPRSLFVDLNEPLLCELRQNSRGKRRLCA